MRRARFIEPARREYLEQLDWYARSGAGLAARFAAEVEDATARAVAFPLAGSPIHPGARRCLLRRFPFALIYQVEKDGIVVLALAHQSRQPEFWVDRLH
ncbi:MAG: type II toxin-antitoxin system RelE/ParE family toxin [Gammaproteobacteria bacterium]